MSVDSLNILHREEAQRIGGLFLKAFYGNLTKDTFEGHANFYSKKAVLEYISRDDSGKAEGVHIEEIYAKLGLNKSFIDLTKGSIKIEGIIFGGLLISVKGFIKREIDDKEVHADFIQRFLVLPDKNIYYIVDESIELANEKIIEPKKAVEPPKPKQSAAPVPEEQSVKSPELTQEVVSSAPPSSYASALGAAKEKLQSAPKQQPAPMKRPAKPASTQPTQQPPAAPHGSDDKRSICLKKVPEGATKEDISNVFSQYGTIVEVTLLSDKAVAFVKFDAEEPVEALLSRDVRERTEKIQVGGETHSMDIWKKERPGQFNRFKPRA